MNKKLSNDMPKSVPTTGRTPEFLAKRYGFSSLSALIHDIPKNATVLDIGAGLSLLGHAVAAKRPDIEWVNVDPYYKNSRHKLAAKDAPSNVKYLSDDITSPSSALAKVKAQRIYSYWMLPHLSVHSVKPVERAVGAMWDMLAPNGVMIIGPDKPHRVSSITKKVRGIRFTKKQSREAVQREVVAITRLPAWMRFVQIIQNNYMRGFLNMFLVMLTSSQKRRARRTINYLC
jgi:uncharacterized UPF0146 family protein